MPREIKLKKDEASLKFVNSTFTSYSDEVVVPANSTVLIMPSGNTYVLYAGDRKIIAHEGAWTLNGALQARPVFTNEKTEGFQIKNNGLVVIQGLGQGDYIESHLHRWQWMQGTSEVSAPLGCVHVYGDGAKCDVTVLSYGTVQPWGSRYYHRETR
jgi:hypothetical protein